jgi:HD-GYP domain-containing protein (c-di-GMP phosphodiesterase class II)
MDTIKTFLTIFMSAVANCSLYSKEHSSVDDLTKEAFSLLEVLLNESGDLDIMIIEDDLIANKVPLRDVGLQGRNFLKRLKRKGISRVDFLKEITQPELKRFVAEIADPREGVGTYPHIKSGIIDVKIGGLKLDADFDMDALAEFSLAQIEKVKEAYGGGSPFKKLNIAGLEEIVVNFIVTFKKEVNILKLISPVKSYSEYTYTHATNVAVLTMFQAEALGIRDDLLRDIGITALLHDVGKLFISKDILEKKDSLDQKEWQEIRLHPLYGARYLAKVEGLTRLAPVVAFEHHLRYDGKGYPMPGMSGKKQHLSSQLVAIADYFDALRSRRPYRRAMEIKEVIAIMRKEASGAFNVSLLDNFIKTMHGALSQ